jgi:hypothetical protein
MTPQEIHAVLEAEGAAKNLPEAYKIDLHKHDFDVLVQYNTQQFIWVLRTCGTFLYPLDPQNVSNKYGSRPTDCVQSALKSDNRVLFYHFSDAQLKPVSFDEAMSAAKQAEEVARKVRVESGPRVTRPLG